MGERAYPQVDKPKHGSETVTEYGEYQDSQKNDPYMGDKPEKAEHTHGNKYQKNRRAYAGTSW